LSHLCGRAMMTLMSTKRTLSDDVDDALLPSPAGAGSAAGQPAITPWLQRDDQRLTSQLTEPQRTWVLAVCEASRASGGTLTPTRVVRAAVDRVMRDQGDPAAAAEVLAAG
jgi:hypothetical protein